MACNDPSWMPDPHADPLSSAELVAFVSVFEANSVHGGADALALTQSAVTKRLQSLERRAGVRLFERGRFGAQPTLAGRLLYPEAKQVLTALAHAEGVLAEHRELVDHALSLAASHTIGEFLLPGWLGAFRRQEPDLRAQVEIINSAAVLAAVAQDRAQIGFVEGIDVLSGFETVTMQSDTLVVVVAADHPWARRRSITTSQLANDAYITREAGSGTRAVVNDALAHAGIDLTPTLETASLQSIKRALLSGGFSVLSALSIESEQRTGTLAGLPLRDIQLSRELRAIRSRRRDRRLAAVTRRFWKWLVSHAAEPSTPAARTSVHQTRT